MLKDEMQWTQIQPRQMGPSHQVLSTSLQVFRGTEFQICIDSRKREPRASRGRPGEVVAGEEGGRGHSDRLFRGFRAMEIPT